MVASQEFGWDLPQIRLIYKLAKRITKRTKFKNTLIFLKTIVFEVTKNIRCQLKVLNKFTYPS